MIETVYLDYEGEPVTIKNGKIYDVEPPRRIWSDYLDRYVDSEGDDEYDVDEIYWDWNLGEWCATVYRHEPSDAKLYGLRDWEDYRD